MDPTSGLLQTGYQDYYLPLEESNEALLRKIAHSLLTDQGVLKIVEQMIHNSVTITSIASFMYECPWIVVQFAFDAQKISPFLVYVKNRIERESPESEEALTEIAIKESQFSKEQTIVLDFLTETACFIYLNYAMDPCHHLSSNNYLFLKSSIKACFFPYVEENQTTGLDLENFKRVTELLNIKNLEKIS